ncbi:MAG: carbamoyltransferase C-terminal domain-containing protein [Gallionella sp.]|nr:carbamoyltransferase C-terminal domain-containing protein [Gallionella sp.]
MIVLGICSGHNSGASVLIDGKLVSSVEEERISRIKNDGSYPHSAIAEALSIAGITANDVEMVAIAGLTVWEQKTMRDRILKHDLRLAKVEPIIKKCYWKHRVEWYRRLLNPHPRPTGILAKKPSQTVEHHLSHAASAYYASSFGNERVGVITLDGSGDYSWGSVWLGENGKLQEVLHLPYLYSIGLLYASVTNYLGFVAGRHEGKVLGLAAFGNPEPLLSRLLQHTNMNDWDSLFDATLARVPLRPLTKIGATVISDLCQGLQREDVAAGLQAYTEKVICAWIQEQVCKLKVSKLALAGGVFSNVKLNQSILALPGVENIYVHPNMGDGGLASGAAYEVYARLNGGLRPELGDVYMGTEINRENSLQALQKLGVCYEEPKNLAQVVGRLLAEGKVVARADGRMEYGPRALGNRTVMAPCHDPSINQWLNKKFARTEFMPFAPVVLEEHAQEYFPDWDESHIAARFMTITYDASEIAQKNIPAAVHVDKTARPQVIRREDNPGYYDILKEYCAITGVPSVINTSFNMHEEPIVRTAEEAIIAFQAAGLDALVLGPFLVRT